MFGRFLNRGKAKKPLDYDEAKALARDDDVAVRSDLASRDDLKPEILYFLADDPAPEVRRALARNEATPRQADLMLTRDKSDDVRSDLAGKISRLAPGLSSDETDKIRQAAYEALETLARDQVTRVRQVVAETLKDIADAPPEVIRQLAWDAEIVVSGPVLQFSPVLTDADLLDLIKAQPATGGLSAISQRDGVSENVADAIVDTYDEDAVVFLLRNESAQIREETLDRVIEQAPDFDSWHEPLVKRPKLSTAAAQRLARFVADGLLATLTAREDLGSEAMAAVREAVNKRLDLEEGEAAASNSGAGEEDAGLVLEQVLKLKNAGDLDDGRVVQAVDKGDRVFVLTSIAVMSDTPVKTVEKVIGNQSAKGILALCWKAELAAKTAEKVQQKIARIPTKDLLKARGDSYPLDDADLEWQLEFVQGL